MVRPSPGLMAFHDGVPVEFLHIIRDEPAGELWLVKPIFVAGKPNREQLFRPGDRLTPIHSQSRR
jgi:hypothetical protein